MSCRDQILEILTVLPSSQAALATRAEVTIATVCGWLAVMMAKQEVHICSWVATPRGGKPTAIYTAGPGQNAPRPAPSINALRAKASRGRAYLQ